MRSVAKHFAVTTEQLAATITVYTKRSLLSRNCYFVGYVVSLVIKYFFSSVISQSNNPDRQPCEHVNPVNMFCDRSHPFEEVMIELFNCIANVFSDEKTFYADNGATCEVAVSIRKGALMVGADP